MGPKTRRVVRVLATVFIVTMLVGYCAVTLFPAVVCSGVAVYMACESHNPVVILTVVPIALSVIVLPLAWAGYVLYEAWKKRRY